jgi:hypothetical protein
MLRQSRRLFCADMEVAMSSVFVLNSASVTGGPGLGTDFDEAAFLPLVPGNYVVLVKGQVQVTTGQIFFRLEVGGATDETSFTHHAPSGSFIEGHGTFSLGAAANIPHAGGGARLFVRRSPAGGIGHVSNLRLTAFQVDNLSVVEA